MMDAHIICQNLVSFSIAGVDPNTAAFITYARALAQDNFVSKLSIEERTVLEASICLKAENLLGVSENKTVQELLARIKEA